jgi:hypothetical protein
MKRSKGNAGIYTGIVLSAAGLAAMASPFAPGADMMQWGYAAMVLGFMVFAAGVTALLLFLRRKKVLKRMFERREALARWTYDASQWQAMRNEEMEAGRGVPVFGAILGGIFVVIGLVCYIVDPDEMGLMLAIMAGVGAVIAFTAWLSALLRGRAVARDPGEAVIARGGVWFMGYLTDWNGKTSWFDGARVVKKGKRSVFEADYRYIAGRYARVYRDTLRIPVPDGHEAEAERAARMLNEKPY